MLGNSRLEFSSAGSAGQQPNAKKKNKKKNIYIYVYIYRHTHAHIHIARLLSQGPVLNGPAASGGKEEPGEGAPSFSPGRKACLCVLVPGYRAGGQPPPAWTTAAEQGTHGTHIPTPIWKKLAGRPRSFKTIDYVERPRSAPPQVGEGDKIDTTNSRV